MTAVDEGIQSGGEPIMRAPRDGSSYRGLAGVPLSLEPLTRKDFTSDQEARAAATTPCWPRSRASCPSSASPRRTR